MQTREAIIAEILRLEGAPVNDFFGTIRSDLLLGLSFEDAREYLKEVATPEKWIESGAYTTDEEVIGVARRYLDFAVGKALNHRGLSASRSVDHYKAWVFLVKGEEAVKELEWTDYTNYGVPQLKKACELLGIEDEWQKFADDSENGRALIRMSEGEPCIEDCYDGCGR